MDSKIVEEILIEVEAKLSEIFKDNMLFSFVCGGFAKGYADENHDVDTFICLKDEPSKETEDEYLKWYFDLHKRYKVKPDYNYPGVLITYDKLIETLNILKTLKLTLKIDDVWTKRAIIWADMITSKTAAETGSDLELLYKLKAEYENYPDKWKNEVLALISEEERSIWKNKSHLFIMEHFMKYPKHDGKKLEKYFK